MPSFKTLAAGASLLSAVVAQTSTSCNPTESKSMNFDMWCDVCSFTDNCHPETCPSDTGLDQSSYTVDFTQGASDDWNITYGTVTYDDTNGVTYTIKESGDAPTMQTNWYMFFGVVSVEMKTAPGTGIVSCAILESDDLDEIDWEWLGGTAAQVETNYFGKGNTSTYDRESYVAMANSQEDFHNYTIVWTKETVEWMIDGSVVRTLNYADANGGDNYPQTPMRVKLGIWAGGDSSNGEGTIEWAGGETDYSDGPFTAYVKSVSITNYNPASEYTYSDTSGSYDSITLSGSSSDSSSSSSSTGSETTSSTQTEGASSSTATATTATSSAKAIATGISSSSGSGSDSGAIVSTNSTANAGASNSTSSGSSSNNTSSTGSSSSSSSSSTSSTAATAGAAMWGPSVTVLVGVLGFAAMLG